MHHMFRFAYFFLIAANEKLLFSYNTGAHSCFPLMQEDFFCRGFNSRLVVVQLKCFRWMAAYIPCLFHLGIQSLLHHAKICSLASMVFCSRNMSCNSHQFFLPHQNLAKSHHLSSGAKDSKPLKYINTDIREQNIYDYD